MSENNIDWGAIDEFVADADKDDRYGEHDAMVTGVEEGFWDSGEKFYAVDVVLKTTRNGASLNFRLPEPMTREQLNAAKKGDNARAVALGQRMVSELHKFYGVSGGKELKAGDMLRVKIGPQKSKKTGGNFPRVIAFKPKDELGKGGSSGSPSSNVNADDIPF